MRTRRLAILACAMWIGCSSNNGLVGDPDAGTEDATPDASSMPDGPWIDPNLIIPPRDEEGCHAIYAQDYLPTFHLTIAPEEWAGLHDEWINGELYADLEDQGIIENANPYHPVAEFRYGDVVITDAHARLRGNPRYWKDQHKMQLQVSFNEGKKGRFLGLRKLLFDAASYNRSFLRDRLSMAMMRDLGIRAPCANNARVFVNGEYYGLFTNLERMDKEYLQRAWAANPDGDLWRRGGWELTTNEETGVTDRIYALRDAATVAEMESLLDVEEAMLLWAAEAMIPNADGFWAGGYNFYIYDDPVRGKFVVLPWDFDNTFNRLEPTVDPVTWKKEERFRGRPWYDLALSDPTWFDYYIATIERVLAEAYVPARFDERIDQWTEQIKEAAFTDPNKPFSNRTYLEDVEATRQFVKARAAFVEEWLLCWQNGGSNDGEGNCIPAP